MSIPSPAILHQRRERVFLVMAGLFLGTLAMLNILGISRFLYVFSFGGGQGFHWFSDAAKYDIALAVGVLPYPVTFLCTDLISEFYGRRRASFLVLVGLVINLWVVLVLWVAGALPGTDAEPFFAIRELAFGAVTASMIAYLAAQFIDVHLFHFWKKRTRGKALWLRNNGSTLVSQLVDTVAVILITYQLGGLDWAIGEDTSIPRLLLTLILAGYVYKVLAALLDTPVIYLAVALLRRYLHLDPTAEHHADAEEIKMFSREKI